jgi:Na+/H+ antiporter NhaD/arsenite permease-like protein
MNFLAAPRDIRMKRTEHEEFRINGLHNLAWLLLILVAVFLKQPPGLREALMLVAAFGSYKTTLQPIHDANHFSFGPIKEVAWLFAGIFATMVPALDYLKIHAGSLGITAPMHFYWCSGALSGVLDNAPTYLTFLTAAFGLKNLNIDDKVQMAKFLAEHGRYAIAVSLGSVFFGAMTYIGNGPNLMVKAIADHAKVHTPNFFVYIIRFSIPVLLPIFALVGWLFFGR